MPRSTIRLVVLHSRLERELLALRRMLLRDGYRVLEAAHGGEALALWAAHRAEVDASVTDLRMPELGGRALATRLQAERPALPTVLLSGHASEALPATCAAHERFLEKPCAAEELAAALAAVLATRANAPPA